VIGLPDFSAPGAERPLRHAVAIGGGHGLARTLRGLRDVAHDVTAVVTTADDGGSSGRLRRDLGVVPPGDLRMALAALAGDDRHERVLQYRFDTGDLSGHALGNLLLVAIADLAGGDIVAALEEVGRFAGVRGRVLPCTTTPLVLHAHRGGADISGQVTIAQGGTPDRVWIEPTDVAPTPGVLAALASADLIVLGPGSLYTSIIPNLLVPGIAEAATAAAGPVVLVANLREQVGETEGMDLADHLEALRRHAPGLVVDEVLVHAGAAPAGLGAPMDPGSLLGGAPAGWEAAPRVVTGDFLDGHDGHDPVALAAAFVRVGTPVG